MSDNRSTPKDIEDIIRHCARWASGYTGNRLKWDEEEKLKSDMMIRWDRWSLVTTEQVFDTCLKHGMREEDAKTVAFFHKRRVEGHRLVPDHTYKGFHFMRPDIDKD